MHPNCEAVDEILRAAAALVGTAALTRATPELVRAATGQRIGGVAPVGHPTQLPTVVDLALGEFEVVWAVGGIPHAVFPTSFDELVTLTRGRPAGVA